MKTRFSTLALYSTLLASLTGTHAFAGPADYVATPAVEYGEKEIDFKYGIATQKDGQKNRAASMGLGYGATEHWFTEVYLHYTRDSGMETRLETVEWENKFQLTEAGEYPVDAGLLVEFEYPNSPSAPRELRISALLQKDIDRIQLNANLYLERNIGGTQEPDDPHTTGFGYQWQAKYRWLPQFEYGLQGFGETGEWNTWEPANQQIHTLGPALFGKFAIGSHHLKYNAAWLTGRTHASATHTLRTQVEYEF